MAMDHGMDATNAMEMWNKCGFDIKIKGTFLEVSESPELAEASPRQNLPKSCPEGLFDALGEPMKIPTPTATSMQTCRIPTALDEASPWYACPELTVKNTFLNMACKDEDQELAALVAARRGVRTCPESTLSLLSEPEMEESPDRSSGLSPTSSVASGQSFATIPNTPRAQPASPGYGSTPEPEPQPSPAFRHVPGHFARAEQSPLRQAPLISDVDYFLADAMDAQDFNDMFQPETVGQMGHNASFADNGSWSLLQPPTHPPSFKVDLARLFPKESFSTLPPPPAASPVSIPRGSEAAGTVQTSSAITHQSPDAHEVQVGVGSEEYDLPQRSRKRRGGRGGGQKEDARANHGAADSSELVSAETLTSISTRRHRGGRGGAKGATRLWCHIYLDPAMLNAPGFDLIKKLIGRGGCNTKSIYEETWTKIRVRGRGSGHIEERSGREAPVPLMIALAAEHGRREDFKLACERVVDLAQEVADKFEMHVDSSLPSTKGERFWVGELSQESKRCLGSVLDSYMAAETRIN